MLLIALIACVLVAVTATIHAVGLAVLMKILVRSHALSTTGYHHIIWLLIGLTFWLSLIHIAEIVVWWMFYFWQGCLPVARSRFYFSGVTSTTLCSAELRLSKPWRMLAPL